MQNQIEALYAARKKYRGSHVLGLGIFLMTWIARSISKIAGLKLQNLNLAVLLILLLALLYLAYFAMRVNLIERKIKAFI